MTKQDMRLRNRRVRKQALIVRKKIMASINNRILKPLLLQVNRQDNIDQSTLIELLNSIFINSNLNNRVNKVRASRNMKDIKTYSKNYLNEITKVYNKHK